MYVRDKGDLELRNLSDAVLPLPITRKATTDDTFILHLWPVRSDAGIGSTVSTIKQPHGS